MLCFCCKHAIVNEAKAVSLITAQVKCPSVSFLQTASLELAAILQLCTFLIITGVYFA